LGGDFNIIEAIDRTLKWFRRKRARKVPCQRFLNKIARDYGMHGLAPETRERILGELDYQGRILKDDKGHCYVISAKAV
jgi:hypothetical protein